MARALFTLSLLFVLFTTVPVFGAPSQSNAELESPKSNRQKRTFGFTLLGGRDWEEFRRPWPNMSPLSPLKSMMSFFEDEASKESLIKRLDVLENEHKRIVEFLRKIQATKSAKLCGASSTERPAEMQPDSVTFSTPVSTVAPAIDIRVQTDAPVQPTTQAPTSIGSTTSQVEHKTEPSTPAKISTAVIQDKTEPSTPAKISTAVIQDKTEPTALTEITESEVEDKTEPSMPAEIASTEVEDKTEPPTRPQETYSSVESTEQVSTEKIETPQVDADVPAATTPVVDTNQETTTRVDETNDINYVLI